MPRRPRRCPPMSRPAPPPAAAARRGRGDPRSARVLEPGRDAVDGELDEAQDAARAPGRRAASARRRASSRTWSSDSESTYGLRSTIERWRTGAPSSSRSRPVTRRSSADRAVVLGLDRSPSAGRRRVAVGERGVGASHAHVGLGQAHLGVVEQAREERPLANSRAIGVQARLAVGRSVGLEGRARGRTSPAG